MSTEDLERLQEDICLEEGQIDAERPVVAATIEVRRK